MSIDGTDTTEVVCAEPAEPFEADAAVDFEHRQAGARYGVAFVGCRAAAVAARSLEVSPETT
jgi:hypothetical protein